MRFLIITHVGHKQKAQDYFAYAPYVNEMNLWLKYVDDVEIVAPTTSELISSIDTAYQHQNLQLNTISSIEFTSVKNVILSLYKLPAIFLAIFKASKKADHIHLRCPGNIGLLGCIVQIFFPKKPKTAKYAGNWDPESKQPLSYKLQKWILSNKLLTKNMKVLVYGEWKSQSKNIKSFFTATYNNSEIKNYSDRDYSGALSFVFVGSLVKGKRPLFAIQIIEELYKKEKKIDLDIFGDGVLKDSLKNYIIERKLENIITLHGNKTKEFIKDKLNKAHFSILPSKSEGWPKALAEAMFFGVIPIATRISCVPYMLDFGRRGILIEPDLEESCNKINKYLKDEDQLKLMSKAALNWSQNYTLDVFEAEVSKLLN